MVYFDWLDEDDGDEDGSYHAHHPRRYLRPPLCNRWNTVNCQEKNDRSLWLAIFLQVLMCRFYNFINFYNFFWNLKNSNDFCLNWVSTKVNLWIFCMSPSLRHKRSIYVNKQTNIPLLGWIYWLRPGEDMQCTKLPPGMPQSRPGPAVFEGTRSPSLALFAYPPRVTRPQAYAPSAKNEKKI